MRSSHLLVAIFTSCVASQNALEVLENQLLGYLYPVHRKSVSSSSKIPSLLTTKKAVSSAPAHISHSKKSTSQVHISLPSVPAQSKPSSTLEKSSSFMTSTLPSKEPVTISSTSGARSSSRPPGSTGTNSPSYSILTRPTPSECPPFSLSTVTSFVTSTSTIYTTTVTYPSSSVPIFRTTNSTRQTYTNYKAASTFTIYFSSTATITSVTIRSAASITTIPTPIGFTPVACLPAYLNPTAYSTIITTISRGLYIFSIETQPTVTSTVYPYYTTRYLDAGDLTLQETSTFTVTETRDGATAYAACATNNVVARAPDDSAFYSTQRNGSASAIVPAFDAQDCCSVCQANSSCTGSVYSFGSYPTLPFCQLFLDQTCDPKHQGETAVYAPNPVIVRAISNSGCGQYALSYVPFPRD